MLLVRRVYLEIQVRKELQGLRGIMEMMEPRVLKVILELRVLQEIWVLQEFRVYKEKQGLEVNVG